MKAKSDNLPEQEEEKAFQYRSYGKGELAALYLPYIKQQSAVARFNEYGSSWKCSKNRNSVINEVVISD